MMKAHPRRPVEVLGSLLLIKKAADVCFGTPPQDAADGQFLLAKRRRALP